jgi:hypothetical protein
MKHPNTKFGVAELSYRKEAHMKAFKNLLLGSALAAALAAPLVTATPAQAQGWHGGYGWHGGWHGGYGWHGGWGWHAGYGWRPGWGWGGVYVGVPPIAYAAPYWHFIPGYYAPNGIWIPPHWGY